MNTKINIAAVVIPVYKKDLNKNEVISLTRCKEILNKYDRIIAAPESLDLSNYLRIDEHLNCVRFAPEYFKGFAGYNRLMVSKLFYASFQNYKYILIHQPDVFIFRDELQYWCDKGYDYIGAPWYSDTIKIFLNIAKKNSLIRGIRLLLTKNLRYKSGNGGLSLRKVSSALECLEVQGKVAESWNLNEDYFWSFFSKNYNGDFKIPKFSEAIKFAIEKQPRKAYKLSNYQLPFGVHAWEKWDYDFWKPFIEQQGYK